MRHIALAWGGFAEGERRSKGHSKRWDVKVDTSPLPPHSTPAELFNVLPLPARGPPCPHDTNHIRGLCGGWCRCSDLARIMTGLPQQRHTVTAWGVLREEGGGGGARRVGSWLAAAEKNLHDLSVQRDSIAVGMRENCPDSRAFKFNE